MLLHTDLHAGNVLAAEREPWLAIDPKPYVGDPAYDVTQHIFNGVFVEGADAGVLAVFQTVTTLVKDTGSSAAAAADSGVMTAPP